MASFIIGDERYAFERDSADTILVAPCGCPECSESVQAGHFACDSVPDNLIRAEERGWIARFYDGTWKWCVLKVSVDYDLAPVRFDK